MDDQSTLPSIHFTASGRRIEPDAAGWRTNRFPVVIPHTHTRTHSARGRYGLHPVRTGKGGREATVCADNSGRMNGHEGKDVKGANVCQVAMTGSQMKGIENQ